MHGESHRLATALAPVVRRIRVERALETSPLACALASVGLALGLVARFTAGPVTLFLGLAGVGGLATLAVSAFRSVSSDLAANRADRAHGYDDRLRTAADLVRKAMLTDFERAAVADALGRPIDPRRTVRFRLPRRLVPAIVAVLVLVSGFAVPLRRHAPSRSASNARASRETILDADALDATRSSLDRMRRRSHGRPIESELGALDSILDAVERHAIDREDAFRRLDEIGRRVALAPREADRSAALAELASHLDGRSERLDAVVDALRDEDPRRAADEVAAIASALRSGTLDRRAIDRMREAFAAMAEAARERNERREDLLRRRDELRRELDRNEEPRLLERRRQELERLDRELEALEQQRRELERLERELEQAGEDLNREDARTGADDLDRAFEDLNRMAREQMDEQDRRELEQQLEQLREAMRRAQQRRQSGGGGENDSSESGMRRFQLRAGGGGAGGARIVGPRGEGGTDRATQSGRSGSSGEGGGSNAGEGAGGRGEAPSEGSDGSRERNGSGETVLELGGEGGGERAILELPNGGRPSGSGPGTGRDRASRGRDHDLQSLESPTDLESEGTLAHVGAEHGEGATRSQVIRGAAAAGFSARGYRDIHTDYSDHAEEILRREDVAPGYRYYVRRYFQLIRPREESTP